MAVGFGVSNLCSQYGAQLSGGCSVCLWGVSTKIVIELPSSFSGMLYILIFSLLALPCWSASLCSCWVWTFVIFLITCSIVCNLIATTSISFFKSLVCLEFVFYILQLMVVFFRKSWLSCKILSMLISLCRCLLSAIFSVSTALCVSQFFCFHCYPAIRLHFILNRFYSVCSRMF